MPCYSAKSIKFPTSQSGKGSQTLLKDNRAKTARRSSGFLPNPAYCMDEKPKENRKKCEEEVRQRVLGIGPVHVKLKPNSAVKAWMHPLVPKSAAVVPKSHCDKIKAAATIVTIEERLRALAEEEANNDRKELNTLRTKAYFQEMDEARKEKEALAKEMSGEKKEEKGDDQKVMERVFLAKQEQEEEVKKVNRIILDAKCHAVRDAQVSEKQEMARALREEDLRMDQIMIDNANEALHGEDGALTRQMERRNSYAKGIRQQLEDRENLRFLETERIEEEARLMRETVEAYNLEKKLQREHERERRRKFREDLMKLEEMSTLFKKMLCEQERESDMRIAKYQRDKEEHELQMRAEKKKARESFELKQQRLFDLNQKIMDSRDLRAKSSYLKEQEKIEREYRRKEMEAVQRKLKFQADVNAARIMQLEETKHRQALLIARERDEFKTLARKLRTEEEEKQRLAIDTRCRRACYRDDILAQINDKEMARRRERESDLEYALTLRLAEQKRGENIRAVIKAKLDTMREACLPEKYIKDVEMQLKRIAIAKPEEKKPTPSTHGFFK